MRLTTTLVAAGLAVASSRTGHATAPVAVETHILLKVDAMAVEGDRTQALGTAPETEIGPAEPGTMRLSFPWNDRRMSLELTARLARIAPDGDAVLHLSSKVLSPGRDPVASSREMSLGEEGSGLFEVFGEGDRHLVLTLHGEKVVRAVVRALGEVGEPVRFVLAIERVDGDEIVPLETNELHTFAGQSVEYSFHRGVGDGLEAVRLVLTPATVAGDLVTIDAEIEGQLPGAAGPVVLNHHERIIASRQATSRLTATAGTPAAGYRFQVTPEF